MVALAQSPFPLEQVMSSPFPSELTAAAHGSRVAWVFDAKGVRNVWVADGPDFIHTARQLTHYTADDGQPIASLRLTPDGKTALYALGSELNDAQESANPESWTKGAKQQVFALDVESKDSAPRLLGDMGCPEEDCEDIQISPDGARAVWAAKKKLWLASVDGKQQGKELATVRGAAGEPKWSPDGKHISFVSGRESHSLVAIYDFDGGSIRYMAPSVDKDSMPRWSSDSKWVVWVRTTGDEAKLPLIPVHPQPWSLWIADAATGTGRMLWRSGEKIEDSLPRLTEDVSLNVASGEALCLLGRSGTGKSVTLKLMIALLLPDKGQIRIGGENIDTLKGEQLSHVRRKMGFLFQSAALFDSWTVYENLALPLRRLTSK